MSEAETLRFYLAFYRSEFHHRLFATIHGVQLNATMEADFFGRLTLWECEQCTNVSAWLRSKVWPATCRALVHPSSYHPPDEPYARLGHSHYPVAFGLEFLDTLFSPTISPRRLRRFFRGHIHSPLMNDPREPVTAYFPYTELEWNHMESVAEGLVLEPGTETTDPDFGPRNAMYSIRCDWRSYYDGSTISGMMLEMFGDLLICSVRDVFFAFWDHDRIEEADMLPFFARLARGYASSNYAGPIFDSQSDVKPDEDFSWDSSEYAGGKVDEDEDNDIGNDSDHESALGYPRKYDADEEIEDSCDDGDYQTPDEYWSEYDADDEHDDEGRRDVNIGMDMTGIAEMMETTS